MKISAVINTLNEEKNIAQVINSLKWVDEIIVCDMYSEDKTVEIVKKMGARVVFHKRTSYVEPARNFAISKASHEWILILDADEEIGEELAAKIKEIAEKEVDSDYVIIPRKNIIFGKWMKATMWWPDYNIRLFKKGKVTWSDKIHIPPKTEGQGLDLPAEEKYAILHHHYTSIDQFVTRLNRYSSIQAKQMVKDGYKFDWKDLIIKPLGEFLSRFFAKRGFEDGLHGLTLSLLQAFSFLVMYLKVWGMEKFEGKDLKLDELRNITKAGGKEIDYWFKYGNLPKHPIKRIIQKVRNRLS